MSLVPPSLLQKLARLGLSSRKRAAGARQGERRSIRRGQSQEFADHRPYVAGDDLRFLDWHLYGRLDTLWIKLFEEEEDRVVQLFLDCSGSMEGAKLDFARQLAGALAFVALGRTDRVSVAALSDELSSYAPPRRGRGSTNAVFQTLEAVHPGGQTDLARALERYPRQRGAGIALLFTDLLYEEPVDVVLKRLLARNAEVHLFHILSPVDIRPDLHGDVVLVDGETGEELHVSASERTLDRYEATVHAWAEEMEATCRRLGVSYVRLTSEANLEDVLLRDLRRLGIVQ